VLTACLWGCAPISVLLIHLLTLSPALAAQMIWQRGSGYVITASHLIFSNEAAEQQSKLKLPHSILAEEI